MTFGPSYGYQGIPIHAVYAKRKAYDSYPSCQRDYVWSKGMQQKLIDSVLRGLPIDYVKDLLTLWHRTISRCRTTPLGGTDMVQHHLRLSMCGGSAF
jgi:hypothetical protein